MEERLQKVLARAGIASRRKAEELILEGRVSVNGRAVRELGTKVDPALDEVAVDTVPIPREAAAGEGERTYLLLYKPRGVLCTVEDTHGRPTVLDVVPPFPGKRLYPVGRLDEDSEGLVLLTNDGELTAKLTHPRYGVPKIYEVRVKGHVTREMADEYERGVWLSEGRTGRSRVFIERAGRQTSHVRVTLTEGRNREIRRAWAKLGLDVLTITRIQIGPVVGRGLSAGQFRPLDAEEVQALRESAAGRDSNDALRRPGRRAHQRPQGGRPARPHPAPHGEGAPAGSAPDGEAPRRPRRRGGKPDPAVTGPQGRRPPKPGGRRARGEERKRADPGARGPGRGGPARGRGPGRERPEGGGPRGGGGSRGGPRGPGAGRGPGRGPGGERGPGRGGPRGPRGGGRS